MDQVMTIEERRKLLESTNGKFFSVLFEKKNGEYRNMLARLNVKSHLKGGKSTTSHKPNLITVFDITAGEYRNINLLTIQKIKCNGRDEINVR